MSLNIVLLMEYSYIILHAFLNHLCYNYYFYERLGMKDVQVGKLM